MRTLLKMMTIFLKWIAITVCIMGLSACAKKTGQGQFGDGMDAAGVGDTLRFYGTDLSPEQERELLNKRTYYFEYDRFELSQEDTLSVYAHAKRIITSPRCRVRIEGHTDERGSREYNIALGERRANAVAHMLMLKGVPQSQLSIVSYGKEKPALLGHTEAAWGKNRRVVIVYEVE